MKLREWGLLTATGVLIATVMLVDMGSVSAQQAVSPSYSVDEVFFGTGGQLCDPGISGYSASYCASSSAGDLAAGNAVSPGYQTQAGYNTGREEYIEFVVTNSGTDLGVLSASTASTAVGQFTVKTYLASGYVVHTASDPPTSSGSGAHTFVTSGTAGPSVPGTERFGINLVANTSPSTVGANPVQIPDSTFSFGAAATGYDTANNYKYTKGDIVAESVKSSGQTNYTVTYLFNISTSTPAGQYTFNHNLVATSTF